MFAALTFAFRQLGDPAILRIVLKAPVLTVLIVAVLGTGLWRGLARTGLEQGRGTLAVIGAVIAGWVLWRIAALAVPFVNFLAPLLGAAAATHLVHRAKAPHAV